MKVTDLIPPPDRSASFEYQDICTLPDTPGCYALTNAADDILYIGQAASLRRRLLQHFDTGRQHTLTINGRTSRMWILTLNKITTLSAHERGWINQCELADGVLPPLNKIHAPV